MAVEKTENPRKLRGTIEEDPNEGVQSSSLISSSSLELLQKRSHEEEMSARLYEDMYMFLNVSGFENVGNLWHSYAHEKIEYVDWARGYMMSLGIQPEIKPMPALEYKYTSFADVIRKSYQHELEITDQYKDLAKEASKDEDTMLFALATKYLSAQINRLGKMRNWLNKINTFGDSKDVLLDFELSIK